MAQEELKHYAPHDDDHEDEIPDVLCPDQKTKNNMSKQIVSFGLSNLLFSIFDGQTALGKKTKYKT